MAAIPGDLRPHRPGSPARVSRAIYGAIIRPGCFRVGRRSAAGRQCDQSRRRSRPPWATRSIWCWVGAPGAPLRRPCSVRSASGLEIFMQYRNYVNVLKWTAVSLFSYFITADGGGRALGQSAPRALHSLDLAGDEIHRLDRGGDGHHDQPLIFSSGNPRRRRRTSASIPTPIG